MSIEAMKQALEAIEAEIEFPNTGPSLTMMKDAVVVLRLAIEQAEKRSELVQLTNRTWEWRKKNHVD